MKNKPYTPPTGERLTPPPLLTTLGELTTPLEALRLLRRWRGLSRTADGKGRTVLLLPGYGAGELSMLAIKRYLQRRGYVTVDWGLGRNTGHVPQLLEGVLQKVRQLAGQQGAPIMLVGWSLGGYIAREAARDAPELVSHVVTIGSPVVGGPKYTALARLYRSRGVDMQNIEALVMARYQVPLQVPVTALYSKRDGIVHWEACIDRWSGQVEHIEVQATHLGLGISPEVLEIIGDRIGAAGK